MLDKFAKRVLDIEPSATLALAAKVRELKAKGIDVVELSGGEPDFDTPSHIVEAAIKAVKNGFTRYSPSKGFIELRIAISEKLKRENNIIVDPEIEIIVTPGAKQALLYSVLAFIEPGDEALIPDPCWISYEPFLNLAGGRLVRIPTSEKYDFKLAAEDLEAKITSKTKMLLLTNPNNPTGSVMEQEDLLEIAKIVDKYNLLVLCDEIYEKIIYDNIKFISFASLPGMGERTITVNGFSKTYAMTGWRLGYLAANKNFISQIAKIQEHSATCATAFAQLGALAALTGSQKFVEEMIGEYRKRRDKLCSEIDEIEGLGYFKPHGTFYLFIKIKKLGNNSIEISQELLDEAYISTIPGVIFGPSGEGYLRISFAVPTTKIELFLERIKKYLNGRER